jgi:glucosamine--fructose-6-phosphate aminotransferase (isomerizing)
LPLAAGPERAVAASKTFLNTLAALALLAGGAAGRGAEIGGGLRRVSEQLAESLEPLERAVTNVAIAFAYVGRMYVIGRGIEFGTAREVALKLTETCRVAAEPLTATDLAHGPIAAVDALFPVWTIASRDESLPIVVDAATRLRESGATVVASGNAAAEIKGAAYVLPVPEPPHAILSPLLSVVPGQLFAGALAHAKGLDADYPVGLSKVTRAR